MASVSTAQRGKNLPVTKNLPLPMWNIHLGNRKVLNMPMPYGKL